MLARQNIGLLDNMLKYHDYSDDDDPLTG